MGGQWLILLSLVLGVSSVTPSESIDRLSYYCKRTDLVNSHCVVNGLCVCSPDDFNADCRTNPRFAPEHVLPDEWELMLDSHDYQNLIQDTNPAWVVRDVDGDGGQWTQRGGICQFDLRTCSYSRGPQNNWIFSQYIKYPAGSITHSTEISLDITFRFSQCTGNPACTNDFVTLYRFDTNTIVPLSTQTNPANYIPVFGSITDSRLQQVGLRNVNIMRTFTTPGDYTGFYLGIQDTGTCGQVQRIYLYYTPCKELLDGLVYYPELVRPPVSTDSCYTAEACCAPNSHSTTSLIYRACSDGRCERSVTCECDPGYKIDSSGKECNCCPAGTYRSSRDPQESCLKCPKNTVTDLECAPLCPCIDGYYRRADEGPGVNCTRAPTAVHGLRVDMINDTSVIITWNRPEVIGRDDFYYIIKYTDIANFDQNLSTDPISARYVNSAPTVFLRVPSIASGLELRPNTDYIIKVIVHNGVSDQESDNEPLRLKDITVKTKEGVPSVPLGVRPLPGVVVWGPPANPNGDITGYDVRFLDSSPPQDTIPKQPTESYHIVSDGDITGLGNNIRVQVRARTSAGAGPWSVEQDYVLGCSLPEPTQCPSLSNPSNGVVEISTLSVGGVARYSCLSGYSLVGSSSRTCQSDGSWSGQQPSCKNESCCPTLTNPTNGRVSFPSNLVGGVARYSCLPRYSLVGPSTRVCQSDGSWSGEQPTCVLQQCPTLLSPANGRVSVLSRSVGGVATYSCSSGYLLVGSRTRTCQSDGSWSGQQPRCCLTLTNPTNGRVSFPSHLGGGVARYSCLPGYSLVGSSSRTCQSDGSWSGEQPTCVLQQCPTLLSPANGRVSVPSRSVGGVATYYCSSGYSLVGSRNRTCQSNGSWSGQQPRCVQCPPLTNPANGRVSVPSRLVNSVARYSCLPGYSLVGLSSRTCQSDGSWSGEQPSCTIDVQCPTLTNPTNGQVSVPSRLVGGVARYSCSQGSTLVGPATLICLPIGRWNGTQPTCQNEVHFSLNGRIYTNGSRVLIDDIGVDDNALHCVTSSTDCCQNPKVGNFYYPDGSAVQYGDAGVYRTRIDQAVRLHLRDSALVATGRYICAIPDSRGMLKNIFVDIFRTIEVQCPTLRNPTSGQVSVPSRLVNSVASYSCLSGYSLFGSSSRTCLSDGSWSGEQPSCCPTLTNPTNGRVSFPSHLGGGVARYSCLPGYSLVGSSSRTCLSDGSWSGQQPSCIRELQCPPLTNPTNGQVVISSRSVGGVARYVCLSGYSVNGSSSRTCQSDGSWSGQQPRCVRCPNLINPTNGEVSISSRLVGGVARYSCSQGSTLVGSATLICLPTGRWNGTQPTCQGGVECPTLSNPANGQVLVLSQSVNSIARYACSQGFTLVGSASRICLSTGRWNGGQPACQAAGSKEVHFSLNGIIYQNGSRVPIDDIGVDDNALHCVTSSTDCCRNPKVGNFYYPSGSAVQYGDAGVYRTRIDQAVRLHLRDSALVTSGRYVCEIPDSSGILRYIFVDIVRVQVSVGRCPSLSNPTNGVVSIGSQITGGVATYSCETGYSLAGTTRRTCLSSERWSGSAPTCQVGRCSSLSDPTNGAVVIRSQIIGGAATYSCDTGYSLTGSSFRICLFSRRWSGSAPTCQPTLCPRLPNPTNGVVSIGSLTPGSTATYSCTTGYSLVGTASQRCLSSGRWGGSAPTCTVGFMLNGQFYANGSSIMLSDVGEDDKAILFKTEFTACCKEERIGECYYPDGTPVDVKAANDPLYRNRGLQLIRLNNRQQPSTGLPAPSGLYCCSIPDPIGELQDVCVSITV